MTTRRALLTGLGALICAPAIVRIASIMPVRAWANDVYPRIELIPPFEVYWLEDETEIVGVWRREHLTIGEMASRYGTAFYRVHA